MGDIKIVASGICKKCGHSQQTHEGNQGCTYPVENEPCGCTSIGSY